MEIRRYTSNDRKQISNLLSSEWNYEEELFTWKYEKNPYCLEPFCYVCTDKEKIIGFRGFYEIDYSFQGYKIKVLSPSDVFVSKDFRRQGIFNRMNTFALEDIKKNIKTHIFLNLSSNEKSTPGYLKQGWKKGFDKDVFVYKNLPGITKGKSSSFPFFNKLAFVNLKKKPKFHFNNRIVATRKAYPKMMYDLWKRTNDKSKISILKNLKFFDWIIKNPKSKKIFLYNIDSQGKLLSYIILNEIDNNKCFMIDYQYTKFSHLNCLIEKLMLNNPNLFLMYVSYNSDIETFLSKLGFFKNIFIYKFFNYNTFKTPVLLRPRKVNSDKDWYFREIDIRDKNNWLINPINEDGT